MRRRDSVHLTSLDTLFEAKRGRLLPLRGNLSRLYGRMRIPLSRSHPYVFSNFVTTLDGVVSFNARGHATGGDISGFNAQDRMVMGLLRAVADTVIIGSGTLAADPRHVWTPEGIFPELADEYRRLRAALRKREPPLNVVVTGSGAVDLRLPVFASGKVRALIITTAAGGKRLRKQRTPASVAIRTIGRAGGKIPASAILDEVSGVSPGKLMLVEGGPRLLGDLYAEHLVDEQFLTLAPQIAGRTFGDERLSLVMGQAFAPRDAPWGELIDLRRGRNHLFLRYSFAKSRTRRRIGGTRAQSSDRKSK